MNSFSKLLSRRGKRSQDNTSTSTVQGRIADVSKPGLYTISSDNASNSWTSSTTYGSNGTPVREYAYLPPETPNCIRIPAELNACPIPNRSILPSTIAQPQNYHQRVSEPSHGQTWSIVNRKPVANTQPQSNFIPYNQQNTHSSAVNHEIQMSYAPTYQRPLYDSDRKILEREQNASAQNIRELRGLIRKRYRLDLYLLSERDVHPENRDMILPDCEKAHETLQRIYAIVKGWERESFNAEEWEMVEKIKACLLTKQLDDGTSNEPADWKNSKPWDYIDEVEEALSHSHEYEDEFGTAHSHMTIDSPDEPVETMSWDGSTHSYGH